MPRGGEKRAEAELREALLNAKFEKNRGDSIMAAMGAGVIIQDTDYRIVYQNDLNKDLFGNRRGEFCYRVYEGIDRICDDCPVELTYRDGQIHRSMRSVSTPRGNQHFELTSSPLKDPSGAIVAGIKVVHDVTERVEAAKHLGEEKDFSEALINSLPGIFYLLDSSGRLKRWNRNLELFSGYTPEELLAMNPSDFFEEDEKQLAAEKIREALEEGQSSVKLNLISKDGRKTPFYYTAVRIELSGEPFITGVGMDFSEHKRAEEQLAYSELFLRSIVQNEPECVKILDTDGTVIDMNPAGLAMLEAESPEQVIGKSLFPLIDPEHHEVLIALSEKVCRGEKCVAEFKVLGLKGTPRWLETHSVPFEDPRNSRTLILSVTRDITEKKRSEESIRRQESVIRNLLDLARLEGGGRRYRREDVPLKVVISAELSSGEVLVQAADNGIGMDGTEKEQAFQRFFQRSTATEGSGVGLAICRRIVEDIGGSIRINSEGKNRGTAVVVIMPRHNH